MRLARAAMASGKNRTVPFRVIAKKTCPESRWLVGRHLLPSIGCLPILVRQIRGILVE
jgi:hypothetical protein